MFKKYIIIGLFFLVISAGYSTFGVRNAASTVAGGFHDLSMGGTSKWQYDTFQVCIFCHTPHQANSTQSYATNPNTEVGGGSLNGQWLWNRRLPSRTWQVYQSTTLNGNTSGGPGTISLLCLSCHDGIGAMNVLLNYPTDTATPGMLFPLGASINQFGEAPLDKDIGPLNIGDAGNCSGDECTSGGGNLQNDHPIGFVYDDARALDPGLLPITDAALLDRMVITQGRMECSTCHDPHITNNNTLKNKFLVKDNTGSALCLACHNK